MLEILNYTIALSIVRLSEVQAYASSSAKIVDFDCGVSYEDFSFLEMTRFWGVSQLT